MDILMFDDELLAIGKCGANFHDGQAWKDFGMDWTCLEGILDLTITHMVVHTQNGDNLFAFSGNGPGNGPRHRGNSNYSPNYLVSPRFITSRKYIPDLERLLKRNITKLYVDTKISNVDTISLIYFRSMFFIAHESWRAHGDKLSYHMKFSELTSRFFQPCQKLYYKTHQFAITAGFDIYNKCNLHHLQVKS